MTLTMLQDNKQRESCNRSNVQNNGAILIQAKMNCKEKRDINKMNLDDRDNATRQYTKVVNLYKQPKKKTDN